MSSTNGPHFVKLISVAYLGGRDSGNVKSGRVWNATNTVCLYVSTSQQLGVFLQNMWLTILCSLTFLKKKLFLSLNLSLTWPYGCFNSWWEDPNRFV